MRHELYPKHLAAYVIARNGPLDRSVAAGKAEGAPARKEANVQQDAHSLALKNQDIISRIISLEPLVFKRSIVVSSGDSNDGAQAIYGSLSKADVIKELESMHGIVVDKSALTIDDKIKSTGDYTCTVKLMYAGQASLKCTVVPDAQKSPPDTEGSPKGAAAASGPRPVSTRGPSTVAASSPNYSGSFSGSLGRTAGSPASHGLIEGEAPEQVESMHRRLLYLLSYVVGSPVKITTKSNDVYVGVLDSINPNDAQSVVLRYAYNRTNSKVTQPIDTLVINGSDCLSISSIVSFNEEGQRDGQRSGFKTDTDITGTSIGGKGGERELHRWVPDASESLEAIENDLGLTGDQSLSWDQFAINEKMFGLTTDFDEEIYTTKLDRTRPDYKEREREAIRIAQEIQSTPFLNSHVAEERTETVVDDNGALDEEDKYGAVLRPSGTSGKYVPPYLRGKLDASQPPAKQQSTAGEPQNADTSAAVSSSPEPTVSKDASSESAFSTAISNNSGTVAALAKLNIRTSGHSYMQNTESLSAVEAVPRAFKPDVVASTSPNTAAESTATSTATATSTSTAPLKQPNTPASSKLANLRGLKNRSDVAALNKPMADITEKLNSERERIQQHRQALIKDRLSELVSFHKSFKLSTPMPEDVAEIVGAKKKSPSQEREANTFNGPSKASPELDTIGERSNSASTAAATTKHAQGDTAAVESSNTTAASDTAKPGTEATPAKSNAGATDRTAGGTKPDTRNTKEEDKKQLFKLNTKASSFKPRATATPFVPKISASTSRASSAAGVSEFNPFFGRRVLKRTGVSLWGDAFKIDSGSDQSDKTPTWPYGSRTYRSQFVQEEPEMMMYSSSHGGYMPQYAYGYYNPYQYPPQMAMMPPYSAAAAYGGNVPGYANGPYNAGAAYPSPIMAAGSGNSPVMTAMNGPAPPTNRPLAHTQGTSGSGAGGANLPVVSTPELAADMFSGQMPQQQPSSSSDHTGRSRSDSPSVMYGTPPIQPVHMGMVPPSMAFNGMQSSGYMSPMPPVPHQGYPQQHVPMPMGYAQYPAAPVYGASPPGMVMMHGSPHPDQGAHGGHQHQHQHQPGY
ncbi:poly(A)-binding protein binding protein [Coemansia sp. IMI 209127]|nr:poly(A)-binding protein binding protein [Coemansia sp. IMI 209127]